MVSGILFFGSSEDRFQRNLDGPDKMPCRQRPAGGFLAVVRKKNKAGRALMVSDSQDDEANAYIMKDVSEEGSEEASYEMVEDDEELVAISKVFEQMLDDVDLEM